MSSFFIINTLNQTKKMNIKTLIIGGLIALSVTIAGGLIVNWFDKNQSKVEADKEDVSYIIDEQVRFISEDKSTIIQNIYVENFGNKNAIDVDFNITYPEEYKIISYKVKTSSLEKSEIEDNLTEHRMLKFKIPKFSSKENVRLSFLLEASSKETINPNVTIKSLESKAQKLVSYSEKIQNNNTRTFLDKYLPLLIISQLFVLIPFLIKRFRNLASSPRSSNNLSFLLLHKDLPLKALEILEYHIKNKGADTYELANYSLAKYLNGAKEESFKLIDAAEYYSSTDHEIAIVKFNKSIMLLKEGDLINGKSEFEIAVSKSKKAIKKYVKFSSLVNQLKNKSEDLEKILTLE